MNTDTVAASETALPGPANTKAATQHHSFISRLSTGTGAFNIIGHRKWYYVFSAMLILLSLVFMLVRGFNLSIDFKGGSQLTFQPVSTVTHAEVTKVLHDSINVETESVVDVGPNIQVSLPTLTADQTEIAKDALSEAFDLKGGVSESEVSGTWGSEISERAILSVIVFLFAVAAFVWLRYEHGVAVGAVVSVLHDLVVAAGVYALVGFEVAPATVIGLLTILGFSLYDTVVVYDKVEENTKGMTSLLRRNYPESANLAINQTLMRSINTSIIALLPVAGLLVAGTMLLGSGTLKDLSLVMLCGMAIGAYSSVFVAVPLAVDIKMRDSVISGHARRVAAKRKAEGLLVDADGDPIGRLPGFEGKDETATLSLPGAQAAPASDKLTRSSGPLPGVKPVRPRGKGASSANQPRGKRRK